MKKKRIEIRRFILFMKIYGYAIIEKSFIKLKTKTKFELTLFVVEITLTSVNPMKVSIVIPCFNEETNIKPCLDSLVAQDYTDNFEIVVIDNSSTDQSQSIISNFALLHPFIKLFVEYKKGTAAVRNTGVKRAKYGLVAFIDADCEAPPNWLTLLVNNYSFMKSKHEDGIGVGGRNIAPENANSFIKAIEIVLDTYIGSFSSSQGRQIKNSMLVSHLPLVNALYEKEKIIAIGGFDESLLSEAEDAEINYRLSNAGFRFLFVPDSFVWHKMRSSPKSWFKNMIRYGKGRARLLKRHPKMWRIAYLLPLVFLLVICSSLLVGFSKIFLVPLLYFPALFVFSLFQVIKKKSLHLLLRVFHIYIIQHFGYALGEIYGLLHPNVK